MYGSESSVPGVWRSLLGVVFRVESDFEIENAQVLRPEAKIEKNEICKTNRTKILILTNPFKGSYFGGPPGLMAATKSCPLRTDSLVTGCPSDPNPMNIKASETL